MSTLDKQTTDITEGATVEDPGEKDLVAAAACESQQTAPALEARNLTLVWGNGQVVAKDISIKLQPGTITCLVGRSGCGKTTLLHALAGLLKPQEGKVLLHGSDVTGHPGHIGYMLQKDLLIPSKRIVDNVALPLELKGISRSEARARAQEMLERGGLERVAQSWPHELSGGMRQRVAFLRTALIGSDIMLLDEPFSALDALTRREMRAWLMSSVKEFGLSVLVITHDVDEAVAMASCIYVMAGSPAQGVVTKIVGVVEPQGCADTAAVGSGKDAGQDAELASFDLSEEFLAAKREVLSLLG
ncbi:ABC transporter ATP-binding protein [Atopobium sp. BS2]|uniref:ABC transporter ATP-binding protein n=1 Tax=Atopobium sp. BS2 TaxID=936550 RepID=UPI0004AECB61